MSNFKPKLDDYDVAGWNAFYAENPGYNRSVGGDGDNAEAEAAAAKAAADKAEADKAEADKAAADKTAADKAEADKAAADKAAADKAAADKAAADGDDPPSDKEKELLGEVMKKKEKIGELSGEVAALKEAAKAWDDIDLTAVKEMIQTNKDAEEAALIAAGEFTQVKDQMNEAHALVVTGKDEIIADLNAALAGKDTEIDNLSIGNTFSASKFIQEKLTLPATKARTLYGAHFDRDESGNVVGYNKPAGVDGRAPLVDGNGANLAFDEAFQKIVDADPDKKSLYRSKVKPGAGSRTDPLGGGDDDPPEVASGASRIAAGLADGQLVEGKGLKLSSD